MTTVRHVDRRHVEFTLQGLILFHASLVNWCVSSAPPHKLNTQGELRLTCVGVGGDEERPKYREDTGSIALLRHHLATAGCQEWLIRSVAAFW
jgi:hypothetical protein